jgi:hypothetical protein
LIRRLHHVVLLTFLAAAACRTPAPDATVASRFGMVRATTTATAMRVSRLSDRLVPRLMTLLPGLRQRDVEVWIQEEIEVRRGDPYPDHIAGMADYGRARVYLRQDDDRIELHLAHELVHLLLDDTWHALPGVLEEGLCDVAAALVVDEGGAEHRTKRLIEASAYFGGLDLIVDIGLPEPSPNYLSSRVRLSFDKVADVTPVEALDLENEEVFDHATSDDGVGLYGIGFLLVLSAVDRIGFDGLRTLCERAQTEADGLPREWALKAAGVRPTRRDFEALLYRYLGPSELPSIARVLAEGLAQSTIDAVGGRYSTATVETFLRVGQPHLGLPGSSARVALARVPDFVAAIRRLWPVTEV